MWRAFCQQLRECGRDGSRFIFALLVVLAAVLVLEELGRVGIACLWIGLALLVTRAVFKFVHEWQHPARLGRCPPLSDADLRMARSKLLRRPQKH